MVMQPESKDADAGAEKPPLWLASPFTSKLHVLAHSVRGLPPLGLSQKAHDVRIVARLLRFDGSRIVESASPPVAAELGGVHVAGEVFLPIASPDSRDTRVHLVVMVGPQGETGTEMLSTSFF